jgi:hypothetical protein
MELIKNCDDSGNIPVGHEDRLHLVFPPGIKKEQLSSD